MSCCATHKLMCRCSIIASKQASKQAHSKQAHLPVLTGKSDCSAVCATLLTKSLKRSFFATKSVSLLIYRCVFVVFRP